MDDPKVPIIDAMLTEAWDRNQQRERDAAAQVTAEPPRPKITEQVYEDWVSRMDQVLRRHEEFMNGWLARFEALLSRGIR